MKRPEIWAPRCHWFLPLALGCGLIKMVSFVTVMAETPARSVEAACEDSIVATAIVAPKLDSPFFHTTTTSYEWWIVEDESGHVEDTVDGSIDADDLLRIEHTANCVSSHQGKHVMYSSEAIPTEEGVVFEFSGGMPAYTGTLRITLEANLDFRCAFAASYPSETSSLRWKVTRKELKLKRPETASGSRIYGWVSVSFEEIDSVTTVSESYTIEGYFKPVLQHGKQ